VSTRFDAIWLYLGIGCLFVSGGLFLQLLWFNPSVADLVFEPREVALGLVAPETRHRATFVCRNPRNEVVRVSRVMTSCGCLTAELKTREFATNETAELVAEVEFGSMAGPQRQTIDVEYSIAGESFVRRQTLSVSAEVSSNP
jgi:hypothetical protein